MIATDALDDSPATLRGSRAFWLAHHDVVDRSIKSCSRNRRLSLADAQDLQSEVWLKLLSSDAASTQFGNRSSLSTYVSSIAKNVLLDLRVKELGKWRPTARSQELGTTAIEFDRLVRREGFSPSQAVEALRMRGLTIDERTLETIGTRGGRPQRVDISLLDGLPSLEQPTDHLWLLWERRQIATLAVVALSRALATVQAADRELLRRHFVNGETIASIADGNLVRQRRLYRRASKILAGLRRRLEATGISRDDLTGFQVGDLTNVECCSGFLHGQTTSSRA